MAKDDEPEADEKRPNELATMGLFDKHLGRHDRETQLRIVGWLTKKWRLGVLIDPACVGNGSIVVSARAAPADGGTGVSERDQ